MKTNMNKPTITKISDFLEFFEYNFKNNNEPPFNADLIKTAVSTWSYSSLNIDEKRQIIEFLLQNYERSIIEQFITEIKINETFAMCGVTGGVACGVTGGITTSNASDAHSKSFMQSAINSGNAKNIELLFDLNYSGDTNLKVLVGSDFIIENTRIMYLLVALNYEICLSLDARYTDSSKNIRWNTPDDAPSLQRFVQNYENTKNPTQ